MGRVLLPFDYYEPQSISDAIQLSRDSFGTYLAGGCTLVPALRRRERRDSCLISINKIEGLNEFYAHPKKGLTVGARVHAATLLPDIWAGKRFAALHEAIEQLYPPHIGNMGSIVGNLCSAIPYYDLPTAAMALNAEIHTTGLNGKRIIPLESFYLDTSKNALHDHELATHAFCPPPQPDSGSCFKKIYRSRRTTYDSHKINAAASIAFDQDRQKIQYARIVLGSWYFRPHRYQKAEDLLKNQVPSFDLFTEAASIVLEDLKPITDMEWVEKTRFAQAKVLLRDTIAQAASRAKSRQDPFEDASQIIQNTK